MSELKNNHKTKIAIVLGILLIGFILIYRYSDTKKNNFYNSDATWHTLLTIEAYNETPISKHLFLPIVSLGTASDKNIPWGATIPDSNGNYYYVSFSPAGFVAPWMFFKIFHMSPTENNIYIFNSVLFIISIILLIKLISIIYKKNNNLLFLIIVSTIIYSTSPEILHNMGITYWHQSLMQVMFLIQLIAYLKKEEKKFYKYIFYALSLVNPYIEWTGYVINGGFICVEFFSSWNKNKSKAIRKSLLLVLITISSFLLFCLHYLLVVSSTNFFSALKSRFMARNFKTKVPIKLLIKGYLKSFKLVWIVIILLLIVTLIKNKKIKIENKSILFLCLFPILENFIMLEHACKYSFDRMKLIFPLIIIICELINNLLKNYEHKKVMNIILGGMILLCCGYNLINYKYDTNYIKSSNYKIDNEKFAIYLNKNYQDAIYSLENTYVRGYVNMLFKRGIYEFCDYEKVLPLAQAKNAKYIVVLTSDEADFGNVYKFTHAKVYDINNNSMYKVTINNGIIKNERVY